MSPNNDLTLEKLKIDDRLKKIEEFMIEDRFYRIQFKETLQELGGKVSEFQIEIHGHGEVKGLKDKVGILESDFRDRKKNKDGLLKIATGSITLAVGAFVLWVFKLIWSTVGK